MYLLSHRGTFRNKLNNTIQIDILEKDGTTDTDDVVELNIVSCEVSYPNGNESKYQPIISAVASISIYSGITDTITPETFLTDYYDKWKVVITCDTYKVFEGFIEPSEGGYELRDRPYIVKIDCTDGLGLLKSVPLTNRIGNNFAGRNTLIGYIVGALAKTNMELNIRSYCNLFNTQMLDRRYGDDRDIFWQADLDHRTFLKDSEYVSCYEALEMIFDEAFSLFYWNGRWVISYRPDLINYSGDDCYWTEYDYTGQTIAAGQDLNEQTNIFKGGKIYACDNDQLVSYQVSTREIRLNFPYETPKALVNNEKLLQLGNFISPVQGYEMVGWSQVQGDPTTKTSYGGAKKAYIKIDQDTYGRELNRYFVIEQDTSAPGQLNHQILHSNDDFFVYKGDKISISISVRTKNLGGLFAHSKVALFIGGDVTNQANWYTLDGSNGLWDNNDDQSFAQGIPSGFTTFNTTSVSDIVIPADGKLYIFLGANDNVLSTNELHVKFPEITYTPILSGSDVEVKGGRWTVSQNQNIKDVKEEEVSINDSVRKLIKGALFVTGTENLMPPTWYRYGKEESRSYAEMLAIGLYQHNRRRFKKITGSFRGLLMSPVNNQLDFSPLGFHKHFAFTDDSAAKRYILVPPLRIDYREGKFSGIFMECFLDSDDFVQNWDVHKFSYIF